MLITRCFLHVLNIVWLHGVSYSTVGYVLCKNVFPFCFLVFLHSYSERFSPYFSFMVLLHLNCSFCKSKTFELFDNFSVLR